MRLPSRMDWLGYWANPLDYCHTGVFIEQYSPSLEKKNISDTESKTQRLWGIKVSLLYAYVCESERNTRRKQQWRKRNTNRSRRCQLLKLVRSGSFGEFVIQRHHESAPPRSFSLNKSYRLVEECSANSNTPDPLQSGPEPCLDWISVTQGGWSGLDLSPLETELSSVPTSVLSE